MVFVFSGPRVCLREFLPRFNSIGIVMVGTVILVVVVVVDVASNLGCIVVLLINGFVSIVSVRSSQAKWRLMCSGIQPFLQHAPACCHTFLVFHPSGNTPPCKGPHEHPALMMDG